MKLIDIVDSYLEHPYEIHTDVHKGYHHPSSASCIVKNEYGEDEVIGSCLRKVYWEHKGVKDTNPMSARGSRICAYGKAVERFETEQYKELGIWRDNNVKFINQKYNVSGEADCIVFDKDKGALHGVEVKSGYDYRFRTQVVGTPTRPGKPKPEHLIQTMLYVDYFKFPFSIIYVDRGNAARNEYEITLNADGTPNVDGKKMSNGLSIPRIVMRFKELDEMLEDNTVPKRDFQLKYSKDKLDKLKSSRRMSKANVEEFEKSGDVDIGDWQCISKGTMISTEKGWMPIENVSTENLVQTRIGMRNIHRIWKTKENAETVTIKPYILSDYSATPDHEILVGSYDAVELRTKFTKIKDIDMDNANFVCMPIYSGESGSLNEDEILCLSNFITEGNYHKNEDGKSYKCNFTYNVKESYKAMSVGEAALRLGATSYKIKIVKDNRSEKERQYLKLNVYGVKFVRFIKQYILGEYSYNKSFSNYIMTLPVAQQEELLDLMHSQDGAMLSMRTSTVWNYSTTSKSLALQVQQMMFRLFKITSIVKQTGGQECFEGSIKRDCFHVRWFIGGEKHHMGFFQNDMFYARIRSIEKSEPSDVYDISVNELHEFTTEGGLVHNCSYCEYKDYCWSGEGKDV